MPPKGSGYERELKVMLEGAGCYVGRSAGSHGIDLLAISPTWSASPLIEVKSTSKRDVFYISGQAKEQWKEARALAARGFDVYFAVRWKGRVTKKDIEENPLLAHQWDFWHVNCMTDEPHPLRRGYGEDFEAFLAFWKGYERGCE